MRAGSVLLLVGVLGLICSCAGVLSANGRHELLDYNPVANSKAVVEVGNARFTVLTDRLVRMEYSDTKEFEDRATVAFVNRNLDVPQFTSKTIGGVLHITTKSLELQYIVGSKFSDKSLNVTFGKTSWYYGQPNYGNLLGTIKSLDELSTISLNCTQIAGKKIHHELLHCRWGLISRDGWAVVDDTPNYALTKEYWWDGPNKDTLDLYFFGHGMDYVGALTDFTQVAGKIAMVPRFTSGIMWSRWYNYDNDGVMGVVEDYESRGIPLDVYILDMDWHTKFAWGGYTFDKRLFHIPEATMDWLHQKGLYVAVNLHDDNGVMTDEVEYNALAKYMGLSPNAGDIPFSIVNDTYVYGLEDIVLKHVSDQGVTFWWIDWQQGGKQGGAAGGYQNPTIWLNHIRGTDNLRRGDPTRGIVLARWGGYGNHRYQVGFSGDVASLTWQSLAYQPYFSMTATNVAYGYWSHDLVGPADDLELYTRWLQWGAFSAIFRTHDRGMSAGSCANNDPSTCAIVKVWNVPDMYFKANRAAMVDRVKLTPYTYTALREAYDTGLSLIRPLYYQFPEYDEAYLADGKGNYDQYMFGPDIMVNPVVVPGNKDTSMAPVNLWFPPGKWVEKGTGAIYNGNEFLYKSFDLREIPVYVKAGAIIPSIPVDPGDTIALAMRQYANLVLTIYPGESSGSTRIYEDDGNTVDYLDDKFMWTTASYTRTSDALNLQISSTGKGYTAFPAKRTYVIEIMNALPIMKATVNGKTISYASYGGANTWRYDGVQVTTILETDQLSTSSSVSVDIQFIDTIDDQLMQGIKGALQHATWAKDNFDETRVTPGAHSPKGGIISSVASRGVEMSYLSGTSNVTGVLTILNQFRQEYVAAVNEVYDMYDGPPPPPSNALIQLYDSKREDNCLCGSSECHDDNYYYDMLRIEGYQPQIGERETTSLDDYWDAEVTDNYATTVEGPAPPSGYEIGSFYNGVVYSKPQDDKKTIPLSVYYSDTRKDYLTVASEAGIKYAQDNGYALVKENVGWVLAENSSFEEALKADEVNFKRWSHSVALMDSGFTLLQ